MNDVGTNRNYLSDPYVLIGGALLIYWFIQRKSLIKANANATKSLELLEKEQKASFNSFVESESKKWRVPKKLIEDCKDMTKKEVARMILDNQQMMNKTEMSNDERTSIMRMVDYLENELDKK
jgi:hypothetical protein